MDNIYLIYNKYMGKIEERVFTLKEAFDIAQGGNLKFGRFVDMNNIGELLQIKQVMIVNISDKILIIRTDFEE